MVESSTIPVGFLNKNLIFVPVIRARVPMLVALGKINY